MRFPLRTEINNCQIRQKGPYELKVNFSHCPAVVTSVYRWLQFYLRFRYSKGKGTAREGDLIFKPDDAKSDMFILALLSELALQLLMSVA